MSILSKSTINSMFFLLSMVTLQTYAAEGISLDRNRIVYTQGNDSEVVTVRNESKHLYLLQAGVVTYPDGNIPGPFWVTPPIVRFDAKSQDILRISQREDILNLPRDRESVFYFFANAIPDQSDNAKKSDSARLAIGIKTVIKLFWRPKGLTGSSDKTAQSLKVSRHGNSIVFYNPTPYYASFALIQLNDKSIDIDKNPSMISPYGSLSFPCAGHGGVIRWRLITDYGGVSDAQVSTVS